MNFQPKIRIIFFILFDVLKHCIVTPQKTIWCVPRQLIKSKRGPSPCIKTEERYMKPFPFLAWHHFFWTEVQLPTVNKKANPFQGWLFVILFFSQWYYYSARRVVSHDLLASHSILKQKFQYYYVLFLKVVIYLVLLSNPHFYLTEVGPGRFCQLLLLKLHIFNDSSWRSAE